MSVTDLVYGDTTEVEKLKAIVSSLEQFPDATRHFLYGYRVHGVILGEEMSLVGLRVRSLLNLVKTALSEAEQKAKEQKSE